MFRCIKLGNLGENLQTDVDLLDQKRKDEEEFDEKINK